MKAVWRRDWNSCTSPSVISEAILDSHHRTQPERIRSGWVKLGPLRGQPSYEVSMRVLLVEDDRPLAERLAQALRQENFAVDIAGNGEDGQHLGETEAYDAAVLDLGLPKVTGVAVLRAWRKAGRHLPVLINTARDG